MTGAIPDERQPEAYDELCVTGEPFVELFDGEELDVKMQYPLMGMEHAERRCFVRKEVYERLLIAQDMLPSGVRLRILDGWRPFKLQAELYMKYAEKIMKDFRLERQSKAEQDNVIKKYISEPRKSKMYVPVHTTGGAVDLTLIDKSGTPLQMGTDFDNFSEKAHTNYFENTSCIEIRDNRRLLYHVMIEAGFTNLPSEWWHFDYGNRFWAFYTKQSAMYEGVFTIEEVMCK